MEIQQPVDNNKLANLIISRKFATVDHVRGMWPYISPTRDIGKLLVECGLLPEPIYKKMVEYLRSDTPANQKSQPKPQTTQSPASTISRQSEQHSGVQTENKASVSPHVSVSDQQSEKLQGLSVVRVLFRRCWYMRGSLMHQTCIFR
jgi:hypothetical protein